jgi:hypothetical protein
MKLLTCTLKDTHNFPFPARYIHWSSNIQVMYTNFMNYGHLFGPLGIDTMWLLFKRSNKIHGLLFITNFHVPIIVSASTHGLHHTNRPWAHSRPPKSTAQHLNTFIYLTVYLQWHHNCSPEGCCFPRGL